MSETFNTVKNIICPLPKEGANYIFNSSIKGVPPSINLSLHPLCVEA